MNTSNQMHNDPVDQAQPARPLRIGVIGYGGMGRGTARALAADPAWELVAIADRSAALRERIATDHPGVGVLDDGDAILADPSLDAVALMTLADQRPGQIRAALAAGKHVWAEKPIGASVEEEQALLAEIEASDRHVAVNMFNRNAWYHDRMHAFIAAGEIGSVVHVRVRHQTPGLLPGRGHGPEGPPFHDCGMHYVDVARWYANSEYAAFQAQGVACWGHPEPWQVEAIGRFENGVTFAITQGFIFGHEAAEKRVSCGLEVIGSRGVIVMEHDFDTVRIDLRGTETVSQESGPYGGKKLDVMAARLAAAINGGPVRYPTARDSVVASVVSWQMLDLARANAPQHGVPADLERVVAHAQRTPAIV